MKVLISGMLIGIVAATVTCYVYHKKSSLIIPPNSILFSDVVSDSSSFDKKNISFFCYVTEGMEGISLRGVKQRDPHEPILDKNGMRTSILVRFSDKYKENNRGLESYDLSNRLILATGEFRATGFLGSSSQLGSGKTGINDSYLIVEELKIIE